MNINDGSGLVMSPQESAEATAETQHLQNAIHTTPLLPSVGLGGSGGSQKVGAGIQYSEVKLTVNSYKHSKDTKMRHNMKRVQETHKTELKSPNI